MSSAPLVSAIIIFLNEERFLAQAIGSVLEQSHADWELLLIDDGSSGPKYGHRARLRSAGPRSDSLF